MSKTIIKPSNEDREEINAELKKVNTNSRSFAESFVSPLVSFINFQEIQIDGTFTLEELKEITKVIETAEAWLALESKTIEFDDEETEKNLTQACIECGSKDKPIIKQCEKCGGAIRACCPNHEDNC